MVLSYSEKGQEKAFMKPSVYWDSKHVDESRWQVVSFHIAIIVWQLAWIRRNIRCFFEGPGGDRGGLFLGSQAADMWSIG